MTPTAHIGPSTITRCGRTEVDAPEIYLGMPKQQEVFTRLMSRRYMNAQVSLALKLPGRSEPVKIASEPCDYALW